MWGAEGHWCLGTSGAQPDAALLQLRAQHSSSFGHRTELGPEAAAKGGASQYLRQEGAGERTTRNLGVNSSRPWGALSPPGRETMRGQQPQHPRDHGGAAWVLTSQPAGQTNAFRTESHSCGCCDAQRTTSY